RRQNNHRIGGQPGHRNFPSQLPIRHATAPPIRLLFCCRKAASLILPSYLHARRSRNFRSAVLAARLEVGRIYASGHGFVPPIRPNLYERLCELADPKPAPSLPRSWDDIEVGHFVLATEGPGEGYWEAIVLGRDNDMLTLKWIDYPDDPQLVCHRTALALLKPTAAEPSTAA